MEKSKIETKKITERCKLEMPKKESGKFKLKLTVRGQASMEQNAVGISPATYQDLLKIYPKNADTSKSRNQLPYEGLKTHEVCEVKTRLLENENKCDFDYFSFQLNRPRSSNQTKSPTSSVSSLVSLKTESSEQTPNSDKLTDENDESLKEGCGVDFKGLHAESQRKVTDSSSRFCYNQSIREMRASKRHTDKMTVQDSVAVKRTGIGSRHFDEEDVEIDSRENSIQMQDGNTSSLSEEEGPIKELRDALENTANCLLKCLKSLQNASPRQEKICLIGDTSMKFDCTTPGCKCSEMNLKNFIAKRDDKNSPASLPILHTLKDKSDTDTKRRKGAVTCRSYNPQSINTDFSKSEYHSCNCFNRRCLHFQSTRRHLNTGVLAVNTKSKEKMATSLSQGDFANNMLASNVPRKTSRSSCENKNRCFLPPYDLPISVGKEADSVENETGVGDSSKLIHRSNAGENELVFENCSAPLKKSNLIKNKKYRLKRKSMTEETDSVENETGVGDSSRSNAGENEQVFENCSAPLEKSNLIKNKKYRLKKKSMTEETDSVENETGVGDSSRLMHRSNVGENEQDFENCSAPLEKSNLIKKIKYRLKQKSTTEEMCRDSDQCEKYVEDNDTEDYDTDDNDTEDYDTDDNDTEDNIYIAVMMLFVAFLVIFLSFILFFVG